MDRIEEIKKRRAAITPGRPAAHDDVDFLLAELELSQAHVAELQNAVSDWIDQCLTTNDKLVETQAEVERLQKKLAWVTEKNEYLKLEVSKRAEENGRLRGVCLAAREVWLNYTLVEAEVCSVDSRLIAMLEVKLDDAGLLPHAFLNDDTEEGGE